MANTLSKTGITTGNTVTAGHVTQSIDAFTGTEAYDITLSGSFTMTGGEITGVAGVENPLSASYATTASYALNSSSTTTSTFPYTGSAIITGSLRVEGDTRITSSLRVDGLTRLEGKLTTVNSVERNFTVISDISSNYTVNDNDHVIIFRGSGSGTINMPSPSTNRELIFINAEGAKVTLSSPSGVNGITSYSLPNSASFTQTTAYSYNNRWYVSNI